MVKHWAVQGYQQSSNVCALCNAQCAWMSVVQSLLCLFPPFFCARTGAEIFCLGTEARICANVQHEGCAHCAGTSDVQTLPFLCLSPKRTLCQANRKNISMRTFVLD